MRIEGWSITDVGKKRDHNEDNHLCNPDLGLFIVADGMGGHRAGDTASRTAVTTIEAEITRQIEGLRPVAKSGGTQMLFISDDPITGILVDAVRAASGAILDQSEHDPELSGMGTTTSLLFFHEGRAFYAHVGDSRIYRIRDGEILRVTRDHSLVQEQIDAGLITQDEADRSGYKNIITRSVGFERHIEVDTAEVDLAAGDVFLMCSDGLSNLVTVNEIRDIATKKEPITALQFFVNLANSRGGDDNITAILVKVFGN